MPPNKLKKKKKVVKNFSLTIYFFYKPKRKKNTWEHRVDGPIVPTEKYITDFTFSTIKTCNKYDAYI